MKIALLGYGKMGKVIENIALVRGHIIVAKLDLDTTDFHFNNADVALDFSVANAALNNIKRAIKGDIPVVSGTTGWLDHYKEAVDFCTLNNGAFIYASNFSLGVNLFFELNTYLAKMMQNFEDYTISLEEIHHIHKKDAPSGTAISLANQIIAHTDKTNWTLGDSDSKEIIPITAKRESEVPGTHSINYKSTNDAISIKHTAFNRKGFALGAVIAAEWLIGKQGVFSMKDVLNIG